MSFSKTDELTEYFDYATVGTVSRLGDPSSTIQPLYRIGPRVWKCKDFHMVIV